MFRYLAFTLISTLAGLLCNLLAGAIEQSIGQFTAFQIVAMITGIMATIMIGYYFEARWRLRGKTEVSDRVVELADRREGLRRMRERYDSGIAWSPQEINLWQDHQQRIGQIKERLRKLGELYSDDPIDSMPPPPLGCTTRAALQAKQLSILFVFPFAVALSLSYLASPYMHYAYLAAVHPTPTFTPTPSPTVVVTIAVTEQTPTSVPPTSTATPVPTNTQAPPATPTLQPTPPPPPTPLPTLTPTLSSSQNTTPGP